jgi:hypothetical protein
MICMSHRQLLRHVPDTYPVWLRKGNEIDLQLLLRGAENDVFVSQLRPGLSPNAPYYFDSLHLRTVTNSSVTNTSTIWLSGSCCQNIRLVSEKSTEITKTIQTWIFVIIKWIFYEENDFWMCSKKYKVHRKN